MVRTEKASTERAKTLRRIHYVRFKTFRTPCHSVQICGQPRYLKNVTSQVFALRQFGQAAVDIGSIDLEFAFLA